MNRNSEVNTSLSNRKLEDLLRGLSREKASSDFTQRVVDLASQGAVGLPIQSNRVASDQDSNDHGAHRAVRRWLARHPWGGQGRWVLALALAAAAALGFVLAPWLVDDDRDLAPDVAAQAGGSDLREYLALRNEYRALESELEELRRLVAVSQPVVGLGGSDLVDVLVDLRELLPGEQPLDRRALPVAFDR